MLCSAHGAGRTGCGDRAPEPARGGPGCGRPARSGVQETLDKPLARPRSTRTSSSCSRGRLCCWRRSASMRSSRRPCASGMRRSGPGGPGCHARGRATARARRSVRSGRAGGRDRAGGALLAVPGPRAAVRSPAARSAFARGRRGAAVAVAALRRICRRAGRALDVMPRCARSSRGPRTAHAAWRGGSRP